MACPGRQCGDQDDENGKTEYFTALPKFQNSNGLGFVQRELIQPGRSPASQTLQKPVRIFCIETQHEQFDDQRRAASLRLPPSEMTAKAGKRRVRFESVEKAAKTGCVIILTQGKGLTHDKPPIKCPSLNHRICSRARPRESLFYGIGITDAEKAAFKIGYAEPHIAKIGASVEGANMARPFTSQKFQQEAGALAKDPALLSRRLDRENRMFSTGNKVLGGSRTADNLIDMEDSSRFDPGALALLFQGRLGDGLTQAVGPTLSRIRGRSPAVRQEMGRMLTKTGDEGASLMQQLLINRQREKVAKQAAKLLMVDRLTAAGGVGAGMSQN